MEQTRSRDKLKDWIIESVIICISIILAFWLNNWGEQQTIEARKNKAMCNVIGELQFNYRLLTEDYQPRHRALLAYIDSTIEQLQQPGSVGQQIDIIDQPILMQNLRATAWRLAIETGYVLHVNFDFAAEVAAVYDLQESSFKQMIPRVIEVLMAKQIASEGATLDSQRELKYLFTEWLSQELYLIDNYKKLLENEGVKKLKCNG